MGRAWHERGQYGNIIKHIITSQVSSYNNEKDKIKRTKIAQSIGYLTQIQNSLINSEHEIEKRIDVLEMAVFSKGDIER